ncbi:MAG TPA: polysaccharide pyruvyl transferase family protein [Baekduia sp.]|nr:polysaccharide pyruvyl transferase family protein [Baekduia sp.]
MSRPRATVLHAYSRYNAGDGLLVDLSLEYLKRAEVEVQSIVAFNAASFDDARTLQLPGVLGNRGVRQRARAGFLARGLTAAASGRVRGSDEVAHALRDADLLVGMGGGYLRARGRQELLATAGAHISQLALAVGTATPAIYLPQSIGPFDQPLDAIVRRLLARLDVVCVRDDRSREYLGAAANVRRFPDLAVLWAAEKAQPKPATGSPTVVLVGRTLRGDDGFGGRLRALAERLRTAGLQVVWAVQSHEPGNDDVAFYRDQGIEAEGRLAEVLAAHEPGVVISVRLHGALESLLQGWPAVHLGYERKGWGAFGDLGIDPYVHAAGSFDADLVTNQARALADDPSAYWAAIDAQRPAIAGQVRELVELIRGLAYAG